MKSKTILVIDSDMQTSRVISKKLEAEGYLVFTASRGTVGMTMAKKINPLLIFLNITTPDTNGLRICNDLHAVSSLSKVPIVLLTEKPEKYESRFASTYGIVEFLSKPVDPDNLIKITAQALAAGPLVLEKSPPQAMPAPEPDVMAFDEPLAEEEAFEVSATDEFDSFDEPAFQTQEQDFMDSDIEMAEEDEVPFDMVETESEPVHFEDEPAFSGADEIDFDEPHAAKYEPEEPMVTLPEDKGDDMPFFSDEEPLVPEPASKGSKDYGSDIMRDNVKSRLRKKGKRSGLLYIVVAVALIVGLGGAGYYFLWPSSEGPSVEDVVKMPSKNEPFPERAPNTDAETTQPAPSEKPAAKETVAAKEVEKPAPVPEAKPAATPAPATRKAAPVVASKRFYAVQLGAFSSQSNAESLAGSYKSKGYEAYAEPSSSAGKTIYRVLIGRYDSRSEAASMANQVKAKEKVSAVVYEGK